MKAKYYRFIYRSFENGMCCTGSMAESGCEEKEAFHFLYLGGSSGGCEPGMESTEKKDEYLNGHFHLMIMADFKPLTVKRAVKVLETCRIDQVLFPEMETAVLESLAGAYDKTGDFSKEEVGFVRNPKEYLAEKGVSEGNAVKDKLIFRKGNRRFMIFCVGTDTDRNLLVCHGSEETSPQTEECVMNVKPVTPSRCCSPFVDPENLNCEMKCMLYNDFTQCKRHNQKNGTYFVDGHLILGTGCAMDDFGEIRKALADVWKKIRFICLPDADSHKGWTEELLKAGTAETAQYFVGTENTEETVIKNILINNPYKTFVSVKEQSGLCVSGYYVDRE